MEFISLMEIIGTVAFAASGALVAIEKELDYYGIVFFAIITAVGGGIVRDMLIDLSLPAALANPLYVLISIGTAALVILLRSIQLHSSEALVVRLCKRLVQYGNIIQFFDAIGLAAFTAIGAQAALEHHVYTPFVVLTLAVLTGTGGGILRDVFAKEIPFVFRKEIYAVAYILGAGVFMAAFKILGEVLISMYICFGITLAVRLVAVKFNLHLGKVQPLEGKHEREQ